jgi:hypothetical protein
MTEPRTVRAYWTQKTARWRTPARGGSSRVELVAEHRLRHAVDQQRDQDGREGELHVGDPHDEGVRGPADVARDEAEADAERAGEGDAHEADESEMRRP